MRTPGLTPRQAEVLKVIQRYAKKHGHPPNYIELSRLLRVRYSGAHDLVRRIAEKGHLEVLSRSPNRSIQLLPEKVA